MTHIRNGVAALALFAVVGTAIASAVTAVIPGGTTAPTFIANFAAGTYQLTATGIVDLASDGTFRLTPDGKPETVVTAVPYAYFNPNGSDTDVLDANHHGPAGAGVNIGALVGTFIPNPTMASDFFLIGTSTTITFSGALYGFVNDNYTPNTNGSFNLTINAVPEPSQTALLLTSFGALGLVSRRRSRTR